jgi:isopentenyldiphosphate isomerase
MERVDLLDEQGNPLGLSEFRTIAHSNGLWHRTVHIWIRNAAGDLLLQRRSMNKETFPGLLDISAAGHISAGDSSSDAAVREVREELGVSINNSDLKLLFTIRHEYITPDGTFIDREFSDIYLLMVPIDAAKITPDIEEVSGFIFFNINTLKNELVTNKDAFVPHDEEYRRLFEAIEGAE